MQLQAICANIRDVREVNSNSSGGNSMKRRLGMAAAFLVLVLAAPWAAQGAELKVGDKASDFTLIDTNWKPVKLSDFLGKKNVVLAFYVLAFTGG